ncbi:hypothetical protein RND71_042816 [Anisodus tanguticus]|uniref:Uncharacterized protein n=1 Tax=Anisodus tanguticus TaxID=243964 RepID=A0AAE1QS75_9SOLA|nr:hypothetical protein RND71_042816 [Anisodus tanguticus]
MFLRRKPFNTYLYWEDLLPFRFWEIWITRNNNLFNAKKDSVQIGKIINHATEYHLCARNTKHKILGTKISLKWNPPPRNFFKLNTDCACEKSLRNRDMVSLGTIMEIVCQDSWELFMQPQSIRLIFYHQTRLLLINMENRRYDTITDNKIVWRTP